MKTWFVNEEWDAGGIVWLDETLFDQDERYGVMNRNASRCGAPLERCVISFRPSSCA